MNTTPEPETSDAAPRDVSRWRMAHVELDESTLELRVRGVVVEPERKPLELLMWLLRHPGEVVTKDELFDALWSGRVVTESVLTKCVAKLRQAIGDDGQTLIKTVHGFGYRLVAPVERLDPSAPSPVAPPLLAVGDNPPLRPNWRLVRRYDASRGENWLAEHAKTGEKRVFKFSNDAAGVSQLKREITLHRLLRDTLGPREDIARVLDWNLEEPPCFVELEHCSQGSLIEWTTAQGGAAAVALPTRLELVAQTADALAAAHSAGVLHKDVKPANVLIELDAAGAPRVRLGDFGSARMLDGDRLHALQITRMGFTHTLAADASTSGTWVYLAPEVVAGQPPTVRSDIFALGVLLYQMAVGDLRRALAPGWERDIDDALLREDIAACCDQEPARRLGDAAELAIRLRSLAARRTQRAAAIEAEAEVQRTRAALDRARARRGWLLATAALAVAAAVVTGVLYLQVERARDEAERQAAAARAVNEFLVKDLVSAAHPEVSGVDDATVRSVLAAAQAQLDVRFAGRPELALPVRIALGRALTGIGDPEAAVRLLGDAAGGIGPASARAEAWLAIGEAQLQLSRDGLADEALTQAGPLIAAAGAAAPALRLQHDFLAAIALRNRGDARTAVEHMTALRPRFATLHGDDSTESDLLLRHLGNAHVEAGQIEAGLDLLVEVRRRTERRSGASHPITLAVRHEHAQALRLAGRHAEAEPIYRDAYEQSLRVYGDVHVLTLTLGQGLAASRLPADARGSRELLETLHAGALRRYGADHANTQSLLSDLVLTIGDLGDRPREQALYRELIASQQRTLGPKHLYTLISMSNLARSHLRAREFEVAQQQARIAHEAAAEALGGAHFLVCVIATQRASALIELERRDAARALVEPCAASLRTQLGVDHPHVRNAQSVFERL